VGDDDTRSPGLSGGRAVVGGLAFCAAAPFMFGDHSLGRRRLNFSGLHDYAPGRPITIAQY
jgi:hypothetical protein